MQEIETIMYSDQALQMFQSEIELYGELETGGVMLGSIDNNTIHVEKVSNGGPKAIHEYLYFKADNNYIEMFIDMEIANSSGKLRYLGEWHTHPQIIPEASDLDLDSLYDIAASSNDFCLLLIIGAINYKSESFFNQSISIIKYRQLKSYYFLKKLSL